MERPTEHLQNTSNILPEHAAHSPFDKKVALTMAIVAAAWAAVTMMSHRKHNETLHLQTQAGIRQNKETDQWGFYQAKNIRRHEYEAFGKSLVLTARNPDDSETQMTLEGWKKQV